MNLLIFDLEVDFGEDIQVVANNEHDLRDYLSKQHGFTNITFNDLDCSYGTCQFKDALGYSETAKCKYAKKV